MGATLARLGASPAEVLLDSLGDGARSPTACGRHIAVVVAHADDETIGCGAVLSRLDGATLVCVTDGAPRDGGDARAGGFGSVIEYAAARARELEAAACIALVERRNLLQMNIADQRATHEMATVACGLARLIEARRIRVIVTHAFEGGHPDHDAVALAVHAAAGLARHGTARVEIVEMPLYRLGSHGEQVFQTFAPASAGKEVVLRLDARERWIKRRLARAHASQATRLAAFDLAMERYRIAPSYDFAAPPNEGRVLYAQHAWGVCDHDEWRRLAERGLAELGLTLGDVACRPS